MLHLLPDSAPVLAEAARVLRPGGVLITTVDKDDAYFVEDSDIARTTAELRRQYAPRVTDRCARVLAESRLELVGETLFPGVGQGRSPREWREAIESGHVPWRRHATPDQVADVRRRLAGLPDQDVARPDPLYRLVALKSPGNRRP
ncbi:hypothetical protein [Saccharopolyspora sp. NPDC002376]